MSLISTAFEALFEREKWKYQKRDERTYTFGFRGKNNRYNFWAFISTSETSISVYSIIPMSAPEAKRLEIADYLHRANYDMVIGNFELDMRDGEIRFKASADYGDEEPHLDRLDKLIDCCLAMADKYCPGIGMIVFGNSTPEQAINEIEGPKTESNEDKSPILQ